MILPDFFCNQMKLYHNHTVIWCNTGIVGKVQLPYINTSYDNQMYWEAELKPPQDVIPMESDWPEEELDIVHYFK